jgi:hypothetical protein
MKSVRANASAAPLLVRSHGGWDPHTLWDRVCALQWAFMGGGDGGAWCFLYGPTLYPTLPYPTLPSTTLTYLPSFLAFVPTHLPF